MEEEMYENESFYSLDLRSPRDDLEEYGSVFEKEFYGINNIKPIENLNEKTKTHLKVLVEPVKRFRFRYPTEDAHGYLRGTLPKTYPTVVLSNYEGRQATIRCSIFCHDMEYPHPCYFNTKFTRKTIPSPMLLQANHNNQFTVCFKHLTIMCVARSRLIDEIKRKVTVFLTEENKRTRCGNVHLLDQNIERISSEIYKKFDPNKVRLKFEAFDADQKYICPPVYSDLILNSKCTKTSELKITRLSEVYGPADGNTEIFLLVEKVDKKNIKIRFLEVDDDGNEIWCSFAKLHEHDVHHQYAIVCKTPPYRNLDIQEKVNVFIELFRPSDEATSERRSFTYCPSENQLKKRSCKAYCSFDDTITCDPLLSPCDFVQANTNLSADISCEESNPFYLEYVKLESHNYNV